MGITLRAEGVLADNATVRRVGNDISFYDPKNAVLPYTFVGGMAFMSISLVLLQF